MSIGLIFTSLICMMFIFMYLFVQFIIFPSQFFTLCFNIKSILLILSYYLQKAYIQIRSIFFLFYPSFYAYLIFHLIIQITFMDPSSLLQKQRSDFASAYEQLNQQLLETSYLLDRYYQQACEGLETGKYIVNTSILKQLHMYLSQITKIASLAGNGRALFLLTLNTLHEAPHPEETDIDKFIDKYRDKTQLPLRRWHLEEKHLTRIKNRCTAVTSLSLISNPLQLEQMMVDADLPRIKTFSKISRLSLRSSNIGDAGLRSAGELFENLKEIDLSGCRMVSSEGVKALSGYRYVSLKLNGCEGVSARAVLALISTSYNLNYLEVAGLKVDCQVLLDDVAKIYAANRTNFKWLQLGCDMGTVLLVNKLAYLTHLTSAESITDREVQVLLGDQPQLDGLFFNCCDSLHSDTATYLIANCTKLKYLSLRRFTRLTDGLLQDIVSSLSRLEQLNLSECYELTTRSLIQVANQLRRLRDVNLSRCHNIDDEGVMYLVEKMPSLTSLNLSSCRNITDKVIFHISNHLPTMKALNLEHCDISTEAISYLTQQLPLLEQLVLNYCQHVGDEALCLVAMRLRRLRILELEWCPASQKCLALIAENLPQLRVLNLNYCPAVCDDAAFGLARHAPKLQVLKLQSCEKLTSRALIKLFEPLRCLSHLDLKQCAGVSDLVLQQLCSSARAQLMHLDLSWCTQITDRGILSLSQYQPQLLFLNLNGCQSLSDSAVGWLCATMNQLQYLNLTLCDRITDASVLSVSKNLHALRTLYLCDLKQLTDASVSALAGLPNLEELHLSGCVQISSSSLIALLHNLEKLQCLNIGECSNIFADSLLFLVERMRNLKRFSIASLDVGDKLLDMVGEYMSRLQRINLEYCRSITDQAVIRMLERLPSLLKIQLQNTSISQKTKQAIFEELSRRAGHHMVDI